MFRIRRDRVRLPSGMETDYAYMESRGAVWVVPVTDDGKIVLIKQYRYAVDDWIWEVPAGGKHDHKGSDEELARGVQLNSSPHREPGEIIEVYPVPIAEALAMARGGQIKDSKSALALLMCEPYLLD